MSDEIIIRASQATLACLPDPLPLPEHATVLIEPDFPYGRILIQDRESYDLAEHMRKHGPPAEIQAIIDQIAERIRGEH